MYLMSKMNRYERGTNKRAVERKERAKARSQGHFEEESVDTTSLAFNTLPSEVEEQGIVSHVQGWNVQVNSGGKTFDCVPDNQIAKTITSPKGVFVVGDRVGFVVISDAQGRVTSRKERNSSLSRLRGDMDRTSAFKQERHLMAANVDIAVVVSSCVQPALHPSLIDRYLILSEVGNVMPIICVSKTDLGIPNSKVLSWYEKKLKIPVVFASTVTKEGLGELEDALRGKTCVFVGNSGVGKSSIISIMTGDNIHTQAVSAKGGQGKHTTTRSDLYEWDNDSYIIDTPGIRNLTLGDLPRRRLKDFFHDFREFEKGCQFENCVHENEPVCGVKDAVGEGKILEERYDSYLSILKDLV